MGEPSEGTTPGGYVKIDPNRCGLNVVNWMRSVLTQKFSIQDALRDFFPPSRQKMHELISTLPTSGNLANTITTM